MIEDEDSAIIDEPQVYDKKIISKAAPKPNIGIEAEHTVADEILNAETGSNLDYNALNSFLEATRARDTQYDIIDQMCQDSKPAAVLEQFTEDSTATNEEKETVWVTSDYPQIAKTIKYYIDSLQINKNIYRWANSFIKYGDLYIKLYKRSEYDVDDEIFGSRKNLNEDINLHLTKKEDKFVNYVEMIDNPATVFELTKLGKTSGYIRTHSDTSKNIYKNVMSLNGSNLYQYSVHKNDIDIYEPNQFVHATLDDNSERVTEEVKILLDENENTDTSKSYTYKVKKGHSIFFNAFKIWRELSLLENSLLLSRITKASITRVIQIETGQTAKEETGQILQRFKEMVEQKTALNPGSSMAEYTNPGPMENNIYLATHEGKGAITTSQIGGDYDPKSLADIDYFKNAFYGAFGIPKQWFGETEDGAGFNGGQSLTILSSKYAKKIVKIQAALIQMITSLMNILLVDRGLDTYINKFTINMLLPVTQEDLDRRDAVDRQLQNVSDVMNLVNDIENSAAKLKILKSLISNVINNNEVIDTLQEEIDKLEVEIGDNESGKLKTGENIPQENESDRSFDLDKSLGLETEDEIDTEESEISTEENILPTPGETGVDLINNTNTEEI